MKKSAIVIVTFGSLLAGSTLAQDKNDNKQTEKKANSQNEMQSTDSPVSVLTEFMMIISDAFGREAPDMPPCGGPKG